MHNNLELELRLEPLLQKLVREAPLQAMGLEKNPRVRVDYLELAKNHLQLSLQASG